MVFDATGGDVVDVDVVDVDVVDVDVVDVDVVDVDVVDVDVVDVDVVEVTVNEELAVEPPAEAETVYDEGATLGTMNRTEKAPFFAVLKYAVAVPWKATEPLTRAGNPEPVALTELPALPDAGVTPIVGPTAAAVPPSAVVSPAHRSTEASTPERLRTRRWVRATLGVLLVGRAVLHGHRRMRTAP